MFYIYVLLGIIIFVIIIIVIIIISKFISFKNRIIKMKENINALKSKVRTAKYKYLKVMEKVKELQKENTKNELELRKITQGLFAFNSNNTFATTFDSIQELADQYNDAQNELVDCIKRYNIAISVFPSNVFAAILRFKKEEYVDFENLDLSIKLTDDLDDSGL